MLFVGNIWCCLVYWQ